MVEHVTGNLLEADVEALVNTVNSVGIMGKGIALQFKKAFPENFKAYERACRNEELQPGRMFLFDLGRLRNPRYIVNFPTKRHWKGKSRLEDVASGLRALVELVERLNIRSIAVPPLGCGNGGLDWSIVRPMIEQAFATMPNVRVLLFAPAGAPDAGQMRNNTRRPKMTASGAAFLGLMNRYGVPGYRLTLLEVQKLIYFLQVAGEPMKKVEFAKQTYGPYADVLRHMMERMEGHFLEGYGDGNNKPEVPIRLLPGAGEEADQFLKKHLGTRKRFDRVAELIEGFETPYGMELLSTIHWVATRENEQARSDLGTAIKGVQAWSERKRHLFKPAHIKAAWERLRAFGWL